MWIRDALPKALPNVRTVLFGYDTALPNSNSFQSITDLALLFIASLKASGLGRKPLVFLAHSLGGIVLKETVVTLARGSDPERILHHTVGGVLFGVPSRGMETQALMTMVRTQPNEGLLRDLTTGSEYLRSLHGQFSDIIQTTGIKLFWAYETRTSPTVEVSAERSIDAKLELTSLETGRRVLC